MFQVYSTVIQICSYACVCMCVCVHVHSVSQSCPTLCNPLDCSRPRLVCPWIFPGKNTGVGCYCPSLGNLPHPWIKLASLMSPALAGGFFIIGSPGKPYIYTHIYICICIIFQIIFHYRLLQDIEYSSLWYLVGPCFFFNLFIFN